MEESKIDFVLLWVDGNDENWLKEKNKYSPKEKNDSNSEIRFRDWNTLKYWFRSIEKNAPWFNKIYFVTCGQKPEWLNEANDKIVFVNHKDYIPEEFLPTFNSNVIDLFLNRIPGLSEQFVYFNDDTFLVNKMRAEDFFDEGKTVDSFCFNAISVKSENNIIEHTIINNLEIIAKYFNKNEVTKRNIWKILNFKYGTNIFKSVLLFPWKFFTGIENTHIPIPIFKSTMDEVWNKEEKTLNSIGLNKFRTKNDYNLWLFRYWQLCKGEFIPAKTKKNKYYNLTNENSKFFNNIYNGKYNMVCINDSDENLEFEKVQKELIDIFEKMYPEKSSFEK